MALLLVVGHLGLTRYRESRLQTLVKRQAIDIPALYQPRGRYRYAFGINWRALYALVVAVTPALPGLVYAVNPNTRIGRAIYIRDFNWYYGFFISFAIYTVSSLAWPAQGTLVPHMIDTASEEVYESSEDEKRQEKVEVAEKAA